LPLRRWRQSCLEGDSLGFSGDKISRVRIPYGTKVIRLRIGLDRNQKSSRRLLEGSGKGKSQVKLKPNAEQGLWGMNLPEQLGSELPLEVRAQNKGI
jgi:hypothetical protein